MDGATRQDTRSLNLPDFCAARAVLAVVLIVTLTAVVLAVARQNTGMNFWLDLARTSLFLLWAGMGSAAALCLLRTRLERLPLGTASAIALGSVLAVIALVSLGVLWLGSSALLGPRASNLLLPVAPPALLRRQPRHRRHRRRTGAALFLRHRPVAPQTSSCRRARGCGRCRRASGRISFSTA